MKARDSFALNTNKAVEAARACRDQNVPLTVDARDVALLKAMRHDHYPTPYWEDTPDGPMFCGVRVEVEQ